MKEQVIEIYKLTVVAYGEVLISEGVPSRNVPPIYKTEEGIIIFPSFVSDEYVIYSTTRNMEELGWMIEKKEATEIKEPFPTKPNHTLWIDQNFNPQYGESVEVEETLRRIAFASIEEALEAAKQGKYEEAKKLCNRAISAHSLMDSFPLKAAILKILDKEEAASGVRIISKNICTDFTFNTMIEAYLREIAS